MISTYQPLWARFLFQLSVPTVGKPQYALYVANLIHQDTSSVMKVMHYGLIIACYPNAHAVGLVERQIPRQQRVQ